MLELTSFGEDISIKALKRYRLSTTSPFLSYPDIIECVKKEIATEMGIEDSKTAWSTVKRTIKYNLPVDNPILEKAVESIGGWNHLRNATNSDVADRSNFYKNYEQFYQDHMTELLLTLT